MSNINMLFWQPPSPAMIALKHAIAACEEAVELAERGEAAAAETRLAEAEREAERGAALAEADPPAVPDLTALARDAFRRLAPTPAERAEPLDADQCATDHRLRRRNRLWHARHRLPWSERISFHRQPTAAERRLFAKPGHRIVGVEVQFSPAGLWLRLPSYQLAYDSPHTTRKRDHLHALPMWEIDRYWRLWDE